MPPLSLVTLESTGVALIYGRDEIAVEAAQRLADRLDITVLLTKPGDVIPRRTNEFPVLKGTIRNARGHLGQFELAIDDYALPSPSSRAKLVFGPSRDGAMAAERRVDQARADGVGADAAACAFLGDVAHQAGERGLRGIIGDQPRAGAERRNRRDEHDRTALGDVLERLAAAEHRPGQVGRERVIPLLQINAAEAELAEPDADIEHHGLAFVLLGLAFGLAHTRNRLLTAGCVIAFTGLVEVLQFLAPGRHARMEDFVVDALAASLGLAIAASLDWTFRRTQRSRP